MVSDVQTPPAGPFDLVYSSLAFHYVAGLPRLLGLVHDALAAGGALVFSVEHPLYTAPSRPEWTADGAGRAVSDPGAAGGCWRPTR